MLENIDALIFDLDGTLMDSMWLWKDIDIEYLGRYGFKPPAGLDKEIEGMSFTETAAYFKERFSIPESVEEIKAEWNRLAYKKYAEEVPAKSGAAALLKEAKRLGMKIGMASSNSRELITACLKNNQIFTYFDCITTSCDVAKGKPAPDIYLSVAASMEVDPERCLVFEDVPMGILAGKRAGMKVCAMEDSFSIDQMDTIRELADYYIQSFGQVLDGTAELLH